MDTFLRVLLLQDYNTRLVVIGTVLLGIAAGTVGSLLILRKRALVGDVISHATLPGVGVAFLVMVGVGGTGRWHIGLLAGAALAGILAAMLVLVIKRTTMLRNDAAMAITMSVGFGFGIVLMSVIQDLPTGTQAGLESIIYGKAASMIRADAIGIGIASIVVVLCSTVLFKEFRLLCFDEAFATSQGWSVTTLDILLLLLGTAVTVIGLQAVGLMLVLAMLIIPAAAARYWTDSLLFMMLIAAGLGALGSWIGVTISALVPNMPAGAVIVLSGAALFILSLVLGRRGGLLVRGIQSIRTHRGIHRQHVLRAIFESESTASQGLIAIDDIVARRTWSRRQVRRLLARAMSRGEVQTRAHKVRLTQTGRDAAEAIVRNHRLWEIYLIEHADIAPTHVDRDADAIEHVLGVDLVRELEQILLRGGSLPGSPHPLGSSGSSGSSSGSSGGAPA